MCRDHEGVTCVVIVRESHAVVTHTSSTNVCMQGMKDVPMQCSSGWMHVLDAMDGSEMRGKGGEGEIGGPIPFHQPPPSSPPPPPPPPTVKMAYLPSLHPPAQRADQP